MKVIFVGLHNKPGKMPLCSSTKSGKLIDRVIDAVDPLALFGDDNGFQKTNLYDIEYYPTDTDEQYRLSMDWWFRINPNDDDILVLLGAAVHSGFRYLFLPQFRPNILKIAHPASKRSHVEMNAYVQDVSGKIKGLLNSEQNPEVCDASKAPSTGER